MIRPDPTIAVRDIRASDKNPIARVTLGFWKDKPGQASMVQLTNPIAQHLAFYVEADRKAAFISDLRAALNEWEKTP